MSNNTLEDKRTYPPGSFDELEQLLQSTKSDSINDKQTVGKILKTLEKSNYSSIKLFINHYKDHHILLDIIDFIYSPGPESQTFTYIAYSFNSHFSISTFISDILTTTSVFDEPIFSKLINIKYDYGVNCISLIKSNPNFTQEQINLLLTLSIINA